MPVFIAALMAAALAPREAAPVMICEVGRIALRDLPLANRNRGYDSYYGASSSHKDLLAVCPKLRREVPAGYPMADDDARARAAVHVPLPTNNPRPAFIYTIDIPQISDDLKTAVVRFEYSCTGLCGGILEARYVRTHKGWQRQGAIRVLVVS